MTSESRSIPLPSESRRTSLAARGEPVTWIMGLALSLCVLMVAGLVAMIGYEGLRTFWPRPIDLVTLRTGEKFLGIPIESEPFDPGAEELARLRSQPGEPGSPEAFDADGRPVRRLYRVGNKELGPPFRWVALADVAEIQRPPHAVMLERREWGIWLGEPRAVQRIEGSGVQREIVTVAEGPGPAWNELQSQIRQASSRREVIDDLTKRGIGDVNRRMNDARLSLRQTEIDHARAGRGQRPPLLTGTTTVLALAGVLGAAAFAVRLGRGRRPQGRASLLASRALWVTAVFGVVFAGLEHPWSVRSVSDEQLGQVRERTAATTAALELEYQGLLARIGEIQREDGAWRAVVMEPSRGRFAPSRQSEPDDPMLVSQIVRAVPANAMGFAGKVRVYLDRWREFLLDDPREANTEGGVFPVIFGTVMLTLLLSLAVVPLGVIAAMYLREYARQGPVTSAIRIAINNLAGVPSIVYGVFGLGFFCYTLGAYIDSGPSAALPTPRFWFIAVALACVVVVALAGALLARPRPGEPLETRHRVLSFVVGMVWCVAAGMLVVLLAGIPHFHGFFEANRPAPTLGTRGILWAALTLALMTLPVVIVATEEAIAAVPRTMREGSYGCGASKWQTIRRIVLPGAMPGIMTGTILAMARGAGEVAPLMLVGAVKLAPELPFSVHFPFVHLERSFMHLGFHVYDLGFQSPDSEAARPLVWTTTLLLIAVVVLLNLAAISIRTRLRMKLRSQQF